MAKKQPKIKGAVYSHGKLIGINAFVEHEESRMIFEELPKKMPVDVNINKVDYIINLSDINKPSSYYRIN